MAPGSRADTLATAMRLGVLTSQYPTLSHTFIRREVEALRRREFDVDVFAIRRAAPRDRATGEGASEEARTWYVLPLGPGRLLGDHVRTLLAQPADYLRVFGRALRHRTPGLRSALWSVFYFAEAIVLARELRARGIEHLHNHFADGAATVGMLAAELSGIGWSLTLHGAADFGPTWAPLLPEKLAAARFVVCVSHFGRAQALRALPAEAWDKVIVSRCGFEPQRLAERRTRPEGPTRFVCVARLSPEKGLPGLMRAFAGVVRGGVDAELTLVGDGPERESLTRAAAEGDLAGRVHVLGTRSEEEVVAELAGSDVLVLPSLMEGLPVVLMEAMAMGVAVVAPGLAGIPELVRGGETGLLFAPADWDDLERCLRRLAEAPAERARLAAAAREAARAFEVDEAVAPLARRLAEEARPGAVAASLGALAER